MAFRWSGPPTGPAPDQYEIVQDGQVVGSVPGNVTHYRDGGLAPATSYQLQVIAVRGGQHSRQSPVLNVTTVTPPVSAAALSGAWTASYKTTAVNPPDPSSSIGKVGAKWTDPWTFVPRCPAGACNVTLSGTFDGAAFTSSLTRAGAIYTGTAGLDNWAYCVKPSNKVQVTLHFHIQVQGAKVRGLAWRASSWAGTVIVDFASTAAGNCSADTFNVSVASSA